MQNNIDIRHLTIRIANKTICHDLTLKINPGDRWGVLGPNGSGKTTFLKTIAGLHSLTTGEIRLQNKNISAFSTKEIAQRIGILFQRAHDTFPQSVFEFCLAGRHPHLSALLWETAQDKKIATQALKTMGLENYSKYSVTFLSGGERQRLAIAALLTQTPQFYLLDEPINHLDIQHQIKTLNHFKQLAEGDGKSCVMALHDVNMAQHYCNNILLLLGNGETLQGPPHLVLTTENLKRLYQHPLQRIQTTNNCYWSPEFN